MPEQELGVMTHYFGKVSVAIIELKVGLKIGDQIHVIGPHNNFTQAVESMQIEHASVTQANAGDTAGLLVTQKIHPHDKFFKIT